MSEYFGSNSPEAALNKLFASVSTHLQKVSTKNDKDDEFGELQNIIHEKLVDAQKTISLKDEEELSPSSKRLNNKIKFELSTRVNDIKDMIKDKEREMNERNLIAKRAVLNMVIK